LFVPDPANHELEENLIIGTSSREYIAFYNNKLFGRKNRPDGFQQAIVDRSDMATTPRLFRQFAAAGKIERLPRYIRNRSTASVVASVPAA
jgi:hypothetical protein